jgi:uncharacterized protein GlcG (DUF336 family)
MLNAHLVDDEGEQPSRHGGSARLGRRWGGGFPVKVNGKVAGAIGVSGAPTVENEVDCAGAALALVSDGVLVG